MTQKFNRFQGRRDKTLPEDIVLKTPTFGKTKPKGEKEERVAVLSVWNKNVNDEDVVIQARQWQLILDLAKVNGYRAKPVHFLPAEGRVLRKHLEYGAFTLNDAADRSALEQVLTLLSENRGLRVEFRLKRVSVHSVGRARR